MRELISFVVWPIAGVSTVMYGSSIGYGKETFWGVMGIAICLSVYAYFKHYRNPKR